MPPMIYIPESHLRMSAYVVSSDGVRFQPTYEPVAQLAAVRHELLGPKAKPGVAPRSGQCERPRGCITVSLTSVPEQRGDGSRRMPILGWICTLAEDTELGNPLLIYQAGSKSAFCPGADVTYSLKVTRVVSIPEKWPGRKWTGPCRLGIPTQPEARRLFPSKTIIFYHI